MFLIGGPAIHSSVAYANTDMIDLSLYAVNLPPNEDCTVEVLLTDGTPCASDSVDVMGGSIRTDGEGVLVTSKTDFYQDRPLVWVCHDGTCLDGVEATACHSAANPVSEVTVSCGAAGGTAEVFGPQMRTDPPSSRLTLGIGGGGAGGAGATGDGFDLIASVQTANGTTASLCGVGVPIAPGDDADAVLQSASDAINASATCAAGGVSATLLMSRDDGSEDIYPLVSGVTLTAAGIDGTELMPAVYVAPGNSSGVCFAVAEAGDSVFGQSRILALRLGTLPAGAAGGSITLAEHSGLGSCAITVPTLPGQTANELALAIESAFQASGIPGPHPDCLARNNPRDLTATGSTLRTVHASQLTVCISDPGVEFFLAPQDLLNAHPIARAGIDETVECTGPTGATVALDGNLSTDPDSTPGTHDDIISFEWFEDYGLPTEVLLGSGCRGPGQQGLVDRSTVKVRQHLLAGQVRATEYCQDKEEG